jgi:AcrR family transcriptional regulator
MTYVLLTTERAVMAVIGRPREFDRDAALEAAMFLFWRKGFAATSMNDLCDAMGVRSPSLYAAFGSKEALYLEAIEHYVRTQGPPVWDKLAEGPTARVGIENLLVAGTESLPKSRATPAGCMAMLAAVGDEWPAAVARVVRKVRLVVQIARQGGLEPDGVMADYAHRAAWRGPGGLNPPHELSPTNSARTISDDSAIRGSPHWLSRRRRSLHPSPISRQTPLH